MNEEIFARANALLKEFYGETATFRDDQYEAIEATLTKKRTLVVQRTGWGKSLVYFICTKLLRQQQRGVTLVVSPLIVLMDNQMDAARRMGLQCAVLNSDLLTGQRKQTVEDLKNDALDMVFITPETLFAKDLQAELRNIRIGLFVIDEAHCISDWGHDFRLDYSVLYKIIEEMPADVPMLCTTATANTNVVEDIRRQLRGEVFVLRGPLKRESLAIQVLPLHSRLRRYAWLLENIPRLPGSGVVYCLTRYDCDTLAAYLQENNIEARAYYSRSDNAGKALNHEIEQDFQQNRIKVIVATIKLGMGYDKGDIAFVIHYQMPKNIVSYYQQIGRAGRNIPHAYALLMYGDEDKDIIQYFIRTAFPQKRDSDALMALIERNDGTTVRQMGDALNLRGDKIKKVLSFLLHDGFVRKDGSKYYSTPVRYVYRQAHYDEITGIRIEEAQQMENLLGTTECYERFVINSLDDESKEDCGRCANCMHRELFPLEVSEESLENAREYLDRLQIEITPRVKWATDVTGKGEKIQYINQKGICLARYGEEGYGRMVSEDKYAQGERRFRQELVEKSAAVLRGIVAQRQITCVCPVPSMRSRLVNDFAARLAEALKIGYQELLIKTPAPQQKEMENSAHQCRNAFHSFAVAPGQTPPANILIVDDVVDSGWTLTVCGYRLMEAGAQSVTPFALADSSNRDEE